MTVSKKVFRMGDTPSIDEIRRALEPALKKGGASRAIVFGSYARGEAHGYSDLDLIIVFDTAKRFFDRHSDFAGIRHVWHTGLDMLIYTPAELEQMLAERRAFVEIALEEGIVIYEK